MNGSMKDTTLSAAAPAADEAPAKATAVEAAAAKASERSGESAPGKRRAKADGAPDGKHKAKRKAAARKKRRRRARRIAWIAAAIAVALAMAGLAVRHAHKQAEARLRRAHPMAYEDIIRESAASYGLDPAYVASVVLAESSFVPDAVSYAGARGLMQLMPATAEWIAGKLGETFEADALFDPVTNLRYGCWYLDFLMDRYGGDEKCASSAYHQGQGTVDKWLADPQYSADGATLQVIPSQATDTYVQRILKAYEVYKAFYAQPQD